MASSNAAESREEEGKVVPGPRPGSPADKILNRECEGDELIASLKADPVVSFGNLAIDFNSDFWDFTEITSANINESLLKISFSDGPLKEMLKLYVLTQTLWEEAKVQTLKRNVFYVEEWSRMIGLAPSGIRLLDADEVEKCIAFSRQRVSASYLGNKASAFQTFLRFYEKLWGSLLNREVLGLLEETVRICGAIASEVEGWPAIPADYLRPLMDTARSVMADEGAGDADRITAATIVLLERLGFRIGECLALESGAIEVLPGPCGMADIAQLTFKTWKGARGNGAFITGKTAVDALSLEAYLTLERVCEPYRSKLGVSSLIVYPRQRKVYYPKDSFGRTLHLFLVKNKASIPCLNTEDSFPELQAMPAIVAAAHGDRLSGKRRQAKMREFGLTEGDTLVYPVPHSFRVSFATRLYESGLDFQVIAKLMNQVSPDMAASYVRSDKRIEREYSGIVYQAMLEDDARLLGSHADEFAAKVADYTSKLRGEVCGGIDEIIDACAEHYPLRRKVGGVCIRCGNVVECPSNSTTDHIFCAFSVCGNQCHIFFMADVQLEIVREHIALVEENARCGHARAAENELRKARNVLEGMLLPELAELDRQLKLHGAEHVLERHPQLAEIVENRDKVAEEVEKWQSMQL